MPARNKKRFFFYQLLILLAIIAGYHNTLQSPFVFDDEINITRNTYIQIDSLGIESLKNVFSSFNPSRTRPVANLTFAVNYLLGGYDPPGFHLFNIGIHFLLSILLFRLFIWYLKKADFGESDAFTLAFIAVLLWALNPVQTNAVTYIVQRMTSLCTLFFVASLYSYLQARELLRQKCGQRTLLKMWGWYFSALLCWCLALLTKEIAVIMPLILLLHEIFFFDGIAWKNIKRRNYLLLLGIFVLLVLCIMYLWPKLWLLVTDGYRDRDFTLTERLLTQPRVVVRYLSLFLVPLPSRLTLFYDYQVSRSLFDPIATFWSILLLASLLTSSFLLLRRHKLLSFCILWTFSCLIIESSIIPLELIFEHRFYLPAIGFSLGLVLVTWKVFQLMNRKDVIFNLLWICIIFVMISMTYTRNQDWHNEISIYSDAAEKAPELSRAVNALGVAYIRAGEVSRAEQVFARALQGDSQDVVVLANLYTLYTKQKRPYNAEKYLERLKQAVAEGHFKCSESPNLMLVSETLNTQKRYADIIFLLESLSDCKINNGRYYDKLGLCYARTGDHLKAIANFSRAVAFEPENPYYVFSLARSYLLTGEKENAAALYKQLQNMSVPDELKVPYEQMGRYF